jgi:hypothetical protein
MKLAVAAGGAALVAAAAIYLLFSNGGSSTGTAVVIEPNPPTVAAASPTPMPTTWVGGLRAGNAGEAMLLSCLDANSDGRLDGGDGARFAGLDIGLIPGEACVDPAHHADFYAGPPVDAASFTCDAPKAPLLVMAVASGGSDLLDAPSGESLGLIDIVNAIEKRAAAEGIGTQTVLTLSAILGADPAQTSMEHWLEHYLDGRLSSTPCLRVVIVGHSHGGVTVTSVTAALDDQYASRMLGVLVDRSAALYDRIARELPSRTVLLNIYQLNEGWHGVPLNRANAVDVDESSARAPIAPSDGGGGLALVSHKTLDDSAEVQQRIEDGVMAWLDAGRP